MDPAHYSQCKPLKCPPARAKCAPERVIFGPVFAEKKQQNKLILQMQGHNTNLHSLGFFLFLFPSNAMKP